tara:strand:+ start:4485 stop:5018 length:534 start_codon:yes stop_codon:yes gene_type:complete
MTLRPDAFLHGLQGRRMSPGRKVRRMAETFASRFPDNPDWQRIGHYLRGPHLGELMERATLISQRTGIRLVNIPNAQQVASLTPDIALQFADMAALRRTVKAWWKDNEEHVAQRYPCEVLQWIFEFGWAAFLNPPTEFMPGHFSAYLSFRGPRPQEMPSDVPMHRCLIQLRRLACSG